MTRREEDFRQSLFALQAQLARTDAEGRPIVNAQGNAQPNPIHDDQQSFDSIFQGFDTPTRQNQSTSSSSASAGEVDIKKSLNRLIDRIEQFYERKDMSAYAVIDKVFEELLEIQKEFRRSMYQVNSPHVAQTQEENERLKEQVTKLQNMYRQETSRLKNELQQAADTHERETRDMRERLDEYEKKRVTSGSTRKITHLGELKN